MKIVIQAKRGRPVRFEKNLTNMMWNRVLTYFGQSEVTNNGQMSEFVVTASDWLYAKRKSKVW